MTRPDVSADAGRDDAYVRQSMSSLSQSGAFSLGESVLYLNGHAGSDSPACEVRIPVTGIDKYRELLFARSTSRERPQVVDFGPRAMNLIDECKGFDNYILQVG